MDNEQIDRRENAAMLLSTTGAAIAGTGFGRLFSRLLQPYGAAILIVGIVAHLVGMVSRRRAQASQEYVRAGWEIAFLLDLLGSDCSAAWVHRLRSDRLR